jgi:hypothetical protein
MAVLLPDIGSDGNTLTLRGFYSSSGPGNCLLVPCFHLQIKKRLYDGLSSILIGCISMNHGRPSPETTAAPHQSGEDLERRILYGLACEWEVACAVLRPSHRRLLRAPLFGLGDMQTRWGDWHGARREIRLSRRLVLHHSWDSVREVLLHEMAHQFAEEVLGAAGEPPHGPGFQRACDLLRANPRASGRYPPLDQRHAADPAGPDDKAMNRVRKLMALAGSPNRHEAEIAMARAYQIIEKHNLDLRARSQAEEFATLAVGDPALRHFREDYLLALLLQDFYFVRGIWVSAFVLDRGKMGRVLELSGTCRNVRAAAYVHDFVRHFIRLQWQAYNRHRGLNRQRRSDFAVGILQGFRSKLEVIGAASGGAPGETRAMVRRADPLLARYFVWRYPRTCAIRRSPSSQDRNVLRDGREVGKGLVIHQGIESRESRGLLLTGA